MPVTDELLSTELLTDPLKFAAMMWPDVVFYDKQVDVIQSIVNDDTTFVPAGNMLGKDFVAGFIAVWFFLSRMPCRIVTTSAKDDHLRVLWGEINNFIQTSQFPLAYQRGGPLIINHREIRRLQSDGTECPKSYIKGMVASADSIASMQGHHIARMDHVPRTLFISDESSSVPHEYWQMATTWCHRALVIGNTWPCSNFFYRAVKGDPATNDHGGDRYSADGSRCYRRVIRIKAVDSPNVRLALHEKAAGLEPSGRMIVPGVKPYDEYIKNRETWDPIQQCVSLDADFYEGAEVKLFPVEWLNRAEDIALRTPTVGRSTLRRCLGIDVGEGGDDTSWAVVDDLGVLHLEAQKTPDTSVIPDKTLYLMREYNIRPEDILFDKGGGGQEHADLLRRKGYKVRTVGFGESASESMIVRRMKTIDERTETQERRYVYKNRRAEMYHILRQQLDPVLNELGFGIPAKYVELRRQLQPLPLMFDEEGRICLPPKDKRDKSDKRVTIKDMIGCSPDEADSVVLATFGLHRIKSKKKLRVV